MANVQFECTTSYLGKEITIKTDNFKTLHQALAGIDDLNRDANFLAKKVQSKRLRPNYRKDQEGNEYFGVSEKGSRRNVTFGQLREGGLIPFFPKGEDGYYDPDNPPQRNGRGNGQQQQQRQQAPQQQQAPPPAPATQGDPDDGLPF